MTESGSPQFEVLVRRHARVMAAAIRRVCGRRYQSLVADVQQEVYLALWKRVRGGKEIDHPGSYVYKVASTTALGFLRREASLRELAGEREPGSEAADSRTCARSGLLPVERARLIQEVLARLESDEARALRAYLTGFSYKETARLYGWSESVARHRIYRSIENLARTMKERALAER